VDPVLQQALLGVLRHFLTGAGGVLVTTGYATNDEVTAVITSVIGVISFAVGVAWSWWQKRQAAKAKAVAVAAAVIDTAKVAATKPPVQP
jgi:uncharacterized membrane protein YfcA